MLSSRSEAAPPSAPAAGPASAGAPPAVKRFTAVVRRTAGDDTFVAYGVLNDAVTSDGSFQTMIASDPY